ncbi:MAG: hypothetical protein RSC88_09630, partial [Oscillospiraceae bacterium]
NPPNNPTPLSPFRLFAISLLWIALIVLIYFVLKHKDGRHSTVFYMSGLYFLVSMTAGSLLLNCHSDFGNFLRETSIAYIAALYAAALCLDRKFIKIVALVSILGIVPFWTIEYYPSFGTTRYATASDIAYYDQRAETYANYIIVDPESDDPWDNTVAFDRSSNSLPPILWMPTGIGCNLSVLDKTDDGKLPSPAKYIVTCDGSCNGDGECTHKETTDYLLALGYKLLYRDTDTHNAIFERPDSLDKISS